MWQVDRCLAMFKELRELRQRVALIDNPNEGTNMHPNVESLLAFFEYKHLPEKLQEVSAPICELAKAIATDPNLDGPELTAGMRKLLEAKDCFVRARLARTDK